MGLFSRSGATDNGPVNGPRANGTGTSLLNGAIAVALALTVSRLLGLSRDVFIADRFGASETADIVILVVDLPDMLASALGLLGAASALIVAYGARPEMARLLYAQAGLALGAALLLVTVLVSLSANWLIAMMAPGFSAAATQQAVEAARIAFWALPLIALSWPAIAFAHWRDRYFTPALGGAIVNAVVLLALVSAAAGAAPTWVAIAVVVGAALRWLAIAGPNIGASAPWKAFSGPWQINAKLWKAMATAAGAELGQLVYLIALRSMATLFGAGALTTLSFALKIGLLPLFMIMTALTLVAFSKVVQQAAEASPQEFAAAALPKIGIILFAIALIAPAMAVFSWDAGNALFGWFVADTTVLARIGVLLCAFAPSLAILSINMILRRLLGARGGFGEAMRAEFTGITAFGIFAAALLHLDSPLWSLLLASAAGQMVATLSMLRCLHGRGVDLTSPCLRPARLVDAGCLALTLGAGLYIASLISLGPSPFASLGHLAIGLTGVLAGVTACLGLRRDMYLALRKAVRSA